MFFLAPTHTIHYSYAMEKLQTLARVLGPAEVQVCEGLAEVRRVLADLLTEAELLTNERHKVEEEKRTLVEERRIFETERQCTAEHNARADDPVTLNVGGKLFTTTRQTLCACPGSMLSAWFSGRHTLNRDSNGHVLLDRDPEYFSWALDYLRNGLQLVHLPNDNPEIRARIKQEFDYFCLPWTFDALSLVEQLSSGCEPMVLMGHTRDVLVVDLSPTHAVSGSADKTVRLWDLHTGMCVHTFVGHTDRVHCVAIGSEKVVSGSRDKTVRVWDVHTGRVRAVFPLDDEVWAVGMGQSVVAAGVGLYSIANRLKIWDLASRALLREIVGLDFPYGSRISLQADRHVVATSGYSVKVWDLVSGQCERTFSGHGYSVHMAVYGPGGSVLSCSTMRDGQRECIVWDQASGTRRIRRNVQASGSFGKVSGQHLLLERENRLVMVDVMTGSTVELGGHTDSLTDGAISEDTVATGSHDCTVRLWRPKKMKGKGEKEKVGRTLSQSAGSRDVFV